MKRKTIAVAVVVAVFGTVAALYCLWTGVLRHSSSALRKTEVAGASSALVAAVNERPKSQTSALRPKERIASTPLPPEGRPLKETFSELKSRADVGDADAASRLYKDSSKCAQAQKYRQMLARESGPALTVDLKSIPAEQLNAVNDVLSKIQRATKFVQNNETLCDGLTGGQVDSVVSNALQAALLGDADATNCYIFSNVSMSLDGLLSHPEWLSDYQSNAMVLAQQAIERGDWTMVGLLQHSYAGDYSGRWLSQVSGVDSVKAYQYQKLWALGMSGMNTEDQEFFSKRLTDAANRISPGQQSAADTWALNAYNRYFSGNPNGASSQINPCK